MTALKAIPAGVLVESYLASAAAAQDGRWRCV